MIAPRLGSVPSHAYRPVVDRAQPRPSTLILPPNFVKLLTASISLAGALARKAKRPLAGSITPSGTLGRLLVTKKALAGVLTPAGTLAHVLKLGKLLQGTLSLSGTVRRSVTRKLSGAITPAGTLAKKFVRSLAGTLTMAGALVAKPKIRLTGAVALSGALTPKRFKALSGVLSFVGSLVGSILPFSIAANAPKFRYRPRWLVRLAVGAETKKYSQEDLDTP